MDLQYKLNNIEGILNVFYSHHADENEILIQEYIGEK